MDIASQMKAIGGQPTLARGGGSIGYAQASSQPTLPGYLHMPSGAHSLMDFQQQLNNLKASIVKPVTHEKHYLNSLQWNLEDAQKLLQNQLEDIEARRLPVVRSTRAAQPLPTVNTRMVGVGNGYKQWKKYGNDGKKRKALKVEPLSEPKPEAAGLSGVNPLSFTIKKMR